jgi:hypothetical protein
MSADWTVKFSWQMPEFWADFFSLWCRLSAFALYFYNVVLLFKALVGQYYFEIYKKIT